jgi:hypothetical protein
MAEWRNGGMAEWQRKIGNQQSAISNSPDT